MKKSECASIGTQSLPLEVVNFESFQCIKRDWEGH